MLTICGARALKTRANVSSFTHWLYFFETGKGVIDMARKRKSVNYIAHVEDIRDIASGRNDEHRTMTWREAVEHWEQANGADDYGRAALMAYLGIATTGECALLDDLVDAPPDEEETEDEETG